MTTTLSLLDQTELLQLATAAGAANDAGAAIAYLKEAVSRTDASAFAHYLLGAEYAQIKLYDRAVDEMEAALALDPALAIARLQLGLLWLTMGNGVKSETVLVALDELPEGDALRLFGRGLRYLIMDAFQDCLACFEAGIANNTVNPALNEDMRRLADEVRRVMAEGQQARASEAEPVAADEATQHVLLSAYTGFGGHGGH